jgi:hypothetical protein
MFAAIPSIISNRVVLHFEGQPHSRVSTSLYVRIVPVDLKIQMELAWHIVLASREHCI